MEHINMNLKKLKKKEVRSEWPEDRKEVTKNQ